MLRRIPERLDPWHYADLGKAFSGTMRLDSLPRLSLCLRDAGGEVDFDLRFGRDEQHRATLTGSLRAELVLECQRCLEAVAYAVETEVAVAFVDGIEQAGQLPERLDPCLVEEGRVSFRDLIEDELLLSLPQVPMHRSGACPSRPAERSETDATASEERSDNNPFAVLAELKRDK